MQQETYRNILKTTLIERQKINSSYSLRAFAQSIGLSNSHLSRILNGKQGLSIERAKYIANQIGFTQEEEAVFCLMVQSQDARSKKERETAHEKLKSIFLKNQKNSLRELSIEDYEILREWYNISILELMETEGFLDSPEWIAKQIGITPLLVKESIKKLVNMGVVENKCGKLQKTQKNFKIDQSIPSDLMKNYYSQLLSKAKDSIFLQGIEERHLSSITISLDREDLKTLNKEIDKFRSYFNLLAENLSIKNDKKRNSVYCLTTQFFRINTGANL